MSNDINDALGIAPTPQPNGSSLTSIKKYPALRILSGILSIVAWVIAVSTVIAVLAMLGSSHQNNYGSEGVSWLIILATLVIGAISFITLLAYSELIKVFIDIEANTRTK